MENFRPSEHVVAAMEVSGVRIQVYERADLATLQAILQATKSCLAISIAAVRPKLPADTWICGEELRD